MQKLILVEKDYTYEIDGYLLDGWRVVSVTPAIKCVDKYDTAFYGAYVVIEKEGDEKNA